MKKVHFIAIGGAVMHQLALALQRQGFAVSGSDDAIADPAKSNLAAAGLLPAALGWHPERLTPELDAVVLGMHAKGDNPELLRAQELGLPIYSFPEYVYEVSKTKKRVSIAGSHGKTTITSMILHVLRHEGLDFDYLVGAKLAGFDASVKLSDAPVLVLEGDEYPASVIEKRPKIFFYHPQVTLLSGIAWDHVNVFPTYENYRGQFETYLRGLPAGTRLFYNAEDPEVVSVVETAGGHLSADPYRMPRYRYDEGTAVLEGPAGDVRLAVFGRHNLLNLMGALAVCRELGVSEDRFYSAIRNFTGAARRLEKLLETDRVVAFRDFAHAPSKLQATLEAVREAYPDRTLVALFELHTYSSLSEGFLEQYTGSMDAADTAMVFFSRHALALKGLPALSTETVHNAFGRSDLAVFDAGEPLQQAVKAALDAAPGPACLLLMSSGTFDNVDWPAVVSQG